ncbi:MAG: hypothetical protein ACMUJM_13715 [bacterium]
MKNIIYKKSCALFTCCMLIAVFLLYIPITCYGQDSCTFRVEVSPYQVNIDSGGEAHYVRILTYTWYSTASKVFVYINPEKAESTDPISSEYIKITRDSVGHLVVKIDLVALQEAELETENIHYLKIVVELKEGTDECNEKEGLGEIYIIGKNRI